MSGLLTKATSSFRNEANLPLLVPTDRVMASAGALVLIDPVHSTAPWASGVPANASDIPNVAWQQAATMIGSGTSASLAMTVQDSHQSADAEFERSSLGGLHGIYSQVNNVSGTAGVGRGYVIAAKSLIQTWLFNNPAHAYYISQWSRRTRITKSGSPQPRVLDIGSGPNYLAQFDDTGEYGAGGLGSQASPGPNTAGNTFRAGTAQGFTGTLPGSASGLQVFAFGWGNFSEGYSVWANYAASDIMYRTYIEDMTVSAAAGGYAGNGAISVAARYAELLAMDYGLYQQEVLTTGGKFYGDTFTDPSTFP
jgi:hypothetical protein